jgi:hypothetical protein
MISRLGPTNALSKSKKIKIRAQKRTKDLVTIDTKPESIATKDKMDVEISYPNKAPTMLIEYSVSFSFLFLFISHLYIIGSGKFQNTFIVPLFL